MSNDSALVLRRRQRPLESVVRAAYVLWHDQVPLDEYVVLPLAGERAHELVSRRADRGRVGISGSLASARRKVRVFARWLRPLCPPELGACLDLQDGQDILRMAA